MTIRKDAGTRPSPPDFTPVPRKCKRHDGWTPTRQKGFIEALAETGSVKHAAHAVNMTPEGAYICAASPGREEFATAWLAALDRGVQRLEDIALERAIHGVEVPVYSYGKIIGTRIVHNDRLLMFMLRNRATDRFAAGAPAARQNQPGPEPHRPNSEEVRAEILRRLAETKQRLHANRKYLANHGRSRSGCDSTERRGYYFDGVEDEADWPDDWPVATDGEDETPVERDEP